MIERICPVCQVSNAEEAHVCVECGADLDQAIVLQRPGQLARALPAIPQRWQQAGKAAALGAVALAVELGAAWMQQRANAKPAPLARTSAQPSPRFVARRRIWETYESGQLTHRVVEQTVWNLPDD